MSQIIKEPAKLSENSLICLGSRIPKEFLDMIASKSRPRIDNIRWTEIRNLFVSYQRFYKPKQGLDLEDFTAQLREKILYKFFPVLVEPKELTLFYLNDKPVTCEWNMEYKVIKDPTNNLIQAKKDLSNNMRMVLKDSYHRFQSTEAMPHVNMARIQRPEEFDPDDKQSVEYDLPKERFYLENLVVVEISKDEFGLKYTFHSV